MVLDLISASYIGWPNPALCLSFKVRACLLIDNAKVRRISCFSKFYPPIWGDFQHKIAELMFSTSSLLTLGRVHASMALHSLNRSLVTNRRSSLSRLLPKGRKNIEASKPQISALEDYFSPLSGRTRQWAFSSFDVTNTPCSCRCGNSTRLLFSIFLIFIIVNL